MTIGKKISYLLIFARQEAFCHDAPRHTGHAESREPNLT